MNSGCCVRLGFLDVFGIYTLGMHWAMTAAPAAGDNKNVFEDVMMWTAVLAASRSA
jgi:hypothetical protein